MNGADIPEDRRIYDVSEEGAISLEMQLYGNAYVRGQIPEWWGALGQMLNRQLVEAIQREEDRAVLRGESG